VDSEFAIGEGVVAKKAEKMKLAIAYSTKDQVELTKQTFKRIRVNFIWVDGSNTVEGKNFFAKYEHNAIASWADIRGGADAAIAFKLTALLRLPEYYTHLGLLENDVLMDEDWFEPTMALFEKGKEDGINVGAVSARSYCDRVLIQCDGYAVMHNLGAGMVVFTRQAAELVLRSFRTHWWPANRLLFAQLAGIDLATYAAFRGQEQFVTTDWGWEAQLASHGLASLALTPARCTMIGQVPSLKEQGLELTTQSVICLSGAGHKTFERYRDNLCRIGEGKMKIDVPGIIHRDGNGLLFFPHQLPALHGSRREGSWKLQWSQGFGPFAYRAGEGGGYLSVHISGTSCFLVTGGAAGGQVTVEDTRSGFKFAPDLPAQGDNPVSINVPGGPVRREVTAHFSEGTVFYGLSTADQQLIDPTFSFDWSQLPEAE
jgi:hypothetical protein